jgi:hypothetical protein
VSAPVVEPAAPLATPAPGARRPRRRPAAVGWRGEVAALAAIAGAVAWLYWRPLFEPGVWFPAGGGDLASLIYPNYRFAAESLRAGDLPLWNPYIQSGAPFAADIQSGLLYPVNLVAFYLAPRVGYRLVEGLALFHVWLAGALAYAAGRGLRFGRAGALAGGIAYALSDYFVVHVGNLNLVAGAAWLPLVLLGAHRAAGAAWPDGRPGQARRWIGVGALGLAMTALAGHVQPLLFALVVLALTALVHGWATAGPGDGAGRRLDRAGRLAPKAAALGGIALLGLGAAAVQLIPAAELTRWSIRAEIPFEKSTEYSLPPEQLISLLVPGFFGRGPDGYWGQWLRTEAGYVGILPLVLAGVYLTLRLRSGTPTVFLLGLVGATGLLVALGGYTALHGLLYRFAPVYGSLRAPARTIVLADLAIALMAAGGLSALTAPQRPGERRRFDAYLRLLGRTLAFAAALVPPGLVLLLLLREHPALPRATGAVEGWVMLVVWLGGSLAILAGRQPAWLRPTTLLALALGWLTLDLVTNAQGLEQTRQNPERGFERPAVVEFLRRDPEPFRIDTDTGVWDVWQPNTAMVQRLPDVVGGVHPLELADFRRYWSGLGSRSTALYDLLNARYLIGKKGVPLDRDKFELAFDGDPELSVFRNVRALPRVFLVAGAVDAPDHERAYELVHAPDFDPRAYAVVEGAAGSDARGPAGEARLAVYRSSALTVEVAPTRPGLLVLSEVWYPGWSATVDGRPAPVLRADYLFRAVPVAPGDRRVELRFEPTGWRAGLALTLAAWAAIGALLLAPRRLRR